MLKVGVFGVGHLGVIHVKLLKEIEQYQLVGFYDPDDKRANFITQKFDIQRFSQADDLIAAVDVVDIVSPTITHFDHAMRAMKAGKHVFIEKPLCQTIREGMQLVDLAKQTGVRAQVGHVERFNPAFLAVKDKKLHPLFIETHRLAQFNPRGTDVSVVLDLMIHDLDIILSIVPSTIKQIHASGVGILSDSPDIANVRLEFENGCVANVTASRLSLKKMRKMRIFQRDAYISLDFLARKTEIVQISTEKPDPQAYFEIDTGSANIKKYLTFEHPPSPPVNAIKMELELLANSILTHMPVVVSVSDGYNALKLAHQIMAKINK